MRRILAWKSTTPFRHRCPLLRGSSEAGFTMIEMLATALIVAVIAAGVAEALIATAGFSQDQKARSQANALAQTDQERLKGLSDEQLAALSQSRTLTLDGTIYTIKSLATFLDATGGSSCTTRIAAFFRLVTNVTWSEGSASPNHTVTTSTILTRPSAGSLLVDVHDQTGTNLQGVSVTATGQTTGAAQTAVTDVNGCVVFAGLPGIPVQSYGVKALAPGYVDPNGYDATPNVTAAVNGAGVAVPNVDPIYMGLGGQIVGNFRTISATQTFTNAPGFEMTYFGSLGSLPPMLTTPTASVATPSPTITSLPSITPTGGAGQPMGLFPFAAAGPVYTNNYQAWAGKCDQEQPLQPPTTPVATNVATVTPGASVPATIIEPALDAAVTFNGTGNPVIPTDVKITFTASSGTACSDTWLYPPSPSSAVGLGQETVSGTTYNIYPAPFASTSAPGLPTSAKSGYTGTEKLCADYKSGSTYYNATTSTAFTNTNFAGPSQYITLNIPLTSTGKCP